MVVFTVIDIVLLIAGLAGYLYVVGGQLTRVAGVLEECADLVWEIKANAEVIDGGLGSINSTGRVVAGALPLSVRHGRRHRRRRHLRPRRSNRPWPGQARHGHPPHPSARRRRLHPSRLKVRSDAGGCWLEVVDHVGVSPSPVGSGDPPDPPAGRVKKSG